MFYFCIFIIKSTEKHYRKSMSPRQGRSFTKMKITMREIEWTD